VKLHPVGSIYISVDATNPALLFGGTWQQITGRFLLAAGGGYSAGTTGGEAAHKLTMAEMPSHSHSYGAKYGGGVNSSTSGVHFCYTNQNTGTSGGDSPHNNMPPYLTVYMWKRTA
jgi:microcystin-dependent protein